MNNHVQDMKDFDPNSLSSQEYMSHVKEIDPETYDKAIVRVLLRFISNMQKKTEAGSILLGQHMETGILEKHTDAIGPITDTFALPFAFTPDSSTLFIAVGRNASLAWSEYCKMLSFYLFSNFSEDLKMGPEQHSYAIQHAQRYHSRFWKVGICLPPFEPKIYTKQEGADILDKACSITIDELTGEA